MTCEFCVHARQLVNRKRDDQVVCHLSYIEDSQEEMIIEKILDLKEKPDYSMYYAKSKTGEKGSGLMRSGVAIKKTFNCNRFRK